MPNFEKKCGFYYWRVLWWIDQSRGFYLVLKLNSEATKSNATKNVSN
jgi:hypothetical protein